MSAADQPEQGTIDVHTLSAVDNQNKRRVMCTMSAADQPEQETIDVHMVSAVDQQEQ
jgi:hypothetical protein